MANDYDSAPDIAERQRALQRRQAIMDAMVASSMRAQPTQMAGRIAIRQSPFEALSRVATAYMGNRGQSGIDKEYGELSAESQKRRREEIAKLLPGSELADAFGSDDPIVRRIAADKMKASQPKPKLTTYYENGKERRGVIDLSNPGSAPTPIGGDKPTDPNKPFNPDGTPNEEFQKYELERRAAGRTNFTVDTEQEKGFEKELGKGQAKELLTGRQGAVEAVEMLDTLEQGKKLLNSGAVTGFGAETIVKFGQALKLIGIDVGGDATANAQAYSANMAQNVGKIIKQFGAGTGLSDADREYAEKMAGGKITLDEKAIRKIIDINERAARNVIGRHNERAKGVKTNIPLAVDIPSYATTPQEAQSGIPDMNAIDAELARRGLNK